MEEKPFELKPSGYFYDRYDSSPEKRGGYLVINEGKAEGKLVGGNLCTFNLLQGTEYMPDIKDSILFVEDDYRSDAATFDRDLQSLIHQPGFESVTLGEACPKFTSATTGIPSSSFFVLIILVNFPSDTFDSF